jgi:hypothetical protein
MDLGLRIGRAPETKRRTEMTFSFNRILDVVASFAFVALALTTAGATAVLGV